MLRFYPATLSRLEQSGTGVENGFHMDAGRELERGCEAMFIVVEQTIRDPQVAFALGLPEPAIASA